jgi:hypothetical protein
MEESSIFLRDGSTGAMMDAVLCDEITSGHVKLWRESWVHTLARHNSSLGLYERPEDSHWDWELKVIRGGGLLSYHSFAIVCDGGLQALMICEDLHSSKIPGQFGKPMVYITFLATAPWNRPEIQRPPRYRGCGSIMLLAAIQISRNAGARGRIGLHSLPAAEEFYHRKCGMTPLGEDSAHQNLTYFEMTETQADAFRHHDPKRS